MNREEITKELIEMLKPIMAPISKVKEVKPGDRLAEDLGLDSMASVEFLSVIEDRYELDISNSEAVKVITIDDAVDLALEKLDSS